MDDIPRQSELNRPAINQALNTGLKMLTSEDINTPNAWNKDLATLENFLINLVTGRIMYMDPPPARPQDGTGSQIPRPSIDPPGDQSNGSAGEGDE